MMTQKFLSRPNPALYEINTAAWLFELSQRLGRPILLGDVPAAEWDRLKSMGMDFIWLMGVWARGQEGRKVSLNSPGFQKLFQEIFPPFTSEDIIGSCYSISEYGPDPLVGTWKDLEQARDELHLRGLGLILDFIPNHTGIDHHWLQEHPEYYVQVTKEDYLTDKKAFFPVTQGRRTLYIAYGRDPNFPPWTDTAQLNYFNPATRQALIERIAKIAPYCDGIRCDMAMLVLNKVFQRVWGWTRPIPPDETPEAEFWQQLIERVPHLIYIAEAYWDTEWELQQQGFDFVYDKRLYNRLKSARPHEVYLHLKAEIDYQKKLVRFIENHDEMRSMVAFGPDKVKAAATIFSTLPGMRMYFHGQTEGKQIRLPIQIRQARTEAVNIEIKDFYDKLLSEVNESIYHFGQWRLVEVFPEADNTAENLIACSWKLGEMVRLIITNLSPQPSQGRVRFQEVISELQDYLLIDKLSGKTGSYPGKLICHPGLLVKLPGYRSQILEIQEK
jgi:hypothetical protein